MNLSVFIKELNQIKNVELTVNRIEKNYNMSNYHRIIFDKNFYLEMSEKFLIYFINLFSLFLNDKQLAFNCNENDCDFYLSIDFRKLFDYFNLMLEKTIDYVSTLSEHIRDGLIDCCYSEIEEIPLFFSFDKSYNLIFKNDFALYTLLLTNKEVNYLYNVLK